MILYHISENTETVIKKFIPRIPSCTAGGEDRSIKRICVSSSIECAMMGYPYSMDIIRDIYSREGMSRRVRVYTFNIEDIKEDDLVLTSKLIEDNLVPDAHISKEIWILNEIEPTHCFDIFDIRYEIDESVIELPELREYIIKKDFDDDFDVADCAWDRIPSIQKIQYSKVDIF